MSWNQSYWCPLRTTVCKQSNLQHNQTDQFSHDFSPLRCWSAKTIPKKCYEVLWNAKI